MFAKHPLTAVAVICFLLTWAAAAYSTDAEMLSDAAKAWEQTGSYMTVDGHRVFYHDVGEGPVILLLHGHPSSSLAVFPGSCRSSYQSFSVDTGVAGPRGLYVSH